MSRRVGTAGAVNAEMCGDVGTFAYSLRMGAHYTMRSAHGMSRMSHNSVVKFVLFTAAATIVGGVTVSCTNRTGMQTREQTHVSKCPTVEQVKIALQGTGEQGISLALQGLRCSGISPSEEINVGIGERFARDPSSMQFVLRTGKMTPDQVGDSLLTTPYRLVDKLCAAVRERNKRRRIVKSTINDAKVRKILVQKLRVNAGYEDSVCRKTGPRVPNGQV